jgi:leader peptidase (prepilin peptidase)/N-methyltransferase|tara:strand:+ start:9835 stop:10305 length:471 start_codon:yes stop_codon:yes gene_type:complete
VDQAQAVALAWMTVWIVALSIVDLRSRRLPDPMVATLLAGLVLLDAAAAVSGGRPGSLLWACVSALTYGGLLFTVRALAPSGLGGGDVKLAVPMGWQIGFAAGIGFPTAVLTALVLACLFALVWQVLGRLRGHGWPQTLAFGPWLGAAAVMVVSIT